MSFNANGIFKAACHHTGQNQDALHLYQLLQPHPAAVNTTTFTLMAGIEELFIGYSLLNHHKRKQHRLENCSDRKQT